MFPYLGNNFFYCFCGGPLVEEAPGQLPSLPPPLKSSPGASEREFWQTSVFYDLDRYIQLSRQHRPHAKQTRRQSRYIDIVIITAD